ncbi:MAG: glycosyltransferase family 4 protein [Balneolales bacterium]|nr:glycosyltransferase family 4 protein [Balneolales bacterium]
MQRVSLQLVETLQARPDVEIVTIGQETSWKNIVSKTTLFLFDLFVELPITVEKLKPDVVLFSSMVTASLAPFIRSRMDVPLVTINHGHDVTLSFPPYQWSLKRVFKSLDGVISVSSATRQACIDRGMDPDKGIALPNGFLIDGQYLGLSREESLAKLSEIVKKDLTGKQLLLTTGRLVLRKGHDWFINEVLPKVNSDVEYLILGDGPEMQTIITSVLSSPKREQIHVLGRQTDEILHAAYTASDIFIMPNIRVAGDMEGFGIVMLEANIAGTPVVASDLEGIKDVVENGMNGYRIEVGDSSKFAQTIDRVLTEELQTLSDSARKYVQNQFTWDQVMQRYLQYLQVVLTRYRRAESTDL